VTDASPFERDDLARAERVIAADVADVYRVLDDVQRWPSWVDGVVAPVHVLDEHTYEVSLIRKGQTTAHRVSVTTRGPVHTLYAQVDEEYRIYFRTAPHPEGTRIVVVTEPVAKRRWPNRPFRSHPNTTRAEQLRALLDQLAAYLARGESAPPA
jgi:hypothetical protein